MLNQLSASADSQSSVDEEISLVELEHSDPCAIPAEIEKIFNEAKILTKSMETPVSVKMPPNPPSFSKCSQLSNRIGHFQNESAYLRKKKAKGIRRTDTYNLFVCVYFFIFRV